MKKEDYLAIATPEEWDCWLTEAADRYGKAQIDVLRCFFCEAAGAKRGYVGDGRDICSNCMPVQYDSMRRPLPCITISHKEKIDCAIARLEKVGLWED